MSSKTDKQKVGEIGENIACRFLVKHNFDIIERNYWKKWGEIDIIAKKDGILRFVEVKTVSCENLNDVSYETNTHRPEDNIHPWKLKRLLRTIQTYLLENKNNDVEWQFDAIAIYLDIISKKAKVDFLENIII